ncbi:MAG: hypothetical protein IEMM0002_1089 [bacterium]|nr:MAG: hypothetical protein IEMM0002_1089 [bacterium]
MREKFLRLSKVKYRKKILVMLLTALTAVFAADSTAQDYGTTVDGYLEFSLFDDRGVGWTGSETSFNTRVKLDITRAVYDDILLRLKGEWIPTISEYGRAYGRMKQREGSPEDVYAQFTGMIGRSSELRIGIVKVPFGHFDTMALDERNRAITFNRTREWDTGIRLDSRFSFMDFSFAMINGDGREGIDTNSSKSVAARVVFPAGDEKNIYPETQEITRYPNPRLVNPYGGFAWRIGASGYIGQRYTTPVKIRNTHYGADMIVSYSVFSLKMQYTLMEGGFTDPVSALNESLSAYEYSAAVTTDIDTFRRGYSFFAELAAGITEKFMLTIMAEQYDPDSQSNATVKQETKTRVVIGLKYDFRPRVTGSIFHTINEDPAFGKTGDITQGDSWKGDDVTMAGIALQF